MVNSLLYIVFKQMINHKIQYYKQNRLHKFGDLTICSTENNKIQDKLYLFYYSKSIWLIQASLSYNKLVERLRCVLRTTVRCLPNVNIRRKVRSMALTKIYVICIYINLRFQNYKRLHRYKTKLKTALVLELYEITQVQNMIKKMYINGSFTQIQNKFVK